MTILKGIFFALVFVFFEIGKIPEYSIQLFYLPPQEDKRLGLAASSPIFSGFVMMRCTVIDNIDRHSLLFCGCSSKTPFLLARFWDRTRGAPPVSRTRKQRPNTAAEYRTQSTTTHPRTPPSLPRPTLLCPRVIISSKIHSLPFCNSYNF